MKKLYKISMAVILLTLLLVGCSKPDTNAGGTEDKSLETVLEKKKLVLGLDDSFPPMGFQSESMEIVGFDIDVAKEVAKRMGVELVLQPISWEAKEMELATKNIDCIWNGMTYNDERAKEMTLTTPYMQNTQVAVVLSTSNVNTLEELAGKIVVIQNGSTASDAMDANAEFKNSLKELVKVKNNVQALLDLKTSGSDAVVMDEVVARYYTEKEAGTYKILETVLAEEDYVIGFRKGELALAQEVEKYLKEMDEDGSLAQISEEWFGSDLTTVNKK